MSSSSDIFDHLNRSLAEASLEGDSASSSGRSRQGQMVSPPPPSHEEEGSEMQLVAKVVARRAEGMQQAMRDFGNDFYELDFFQMVRRFEQKRKRIWDVLDPKRKQCFLLGLRSNSVVLCPFCTEMVKHLGKHIEKLHPMFFYKCPFCTLDFDSEDFVPRAISVDMHIRAYHPEECRGTQQERRVMPPSPPREPSPGIVLGTRPIRGS